MTVKELIEKLEPYKDNINQIEFFWEKHWDAQYELEIKRMTLDRGIVTIELEKRK